MRTVDKRLDNEEKSEALHQAREYHIKASEFNVNTSNVPLEGNKLKLFVKRTLGKLIRIFFGWYIRPSKERQTKYNEHMHASTGLLISEAEVQSEIISELREGQRLATESLTALEGKLTALEGELTALKEKNQALELSLEESKKEISALTETVAGQTMEIGVLKAGRSGGGSASANIDEKYFDYALEKLNVSYDPTLIENGLIDYFDFEDKYRGSRETIKERQLQYLPYLKTENNGGVVLELGFGRGEILEMLKENGVNAFGVDCYPPFVEFCKEKGYAVTQGDALTYLTACEDESLNGIVLAQVAEHVNTDYLYQLIKTGYRKLKRGCCFIIETPNPESLATYLNFNLDGTHIKPVHGLTLEYVFKAMGYSETLRLGNEYSEHPYASEMQRALIDGCEDEEKREFYTHLKNVLFGATDLTVIARK